MSEAHKIHLTFYDNIAEQRKAWNRLMSVGKEKRSTYSQFITEAINAYQIDDNTSCVFLQKEHTDLLAEHVAEIVCDKFAETVAACAVGNTDIQSNGNRGAGFGTDDVSVAEKQARENAIDWGFLGDFLG